MNRLEKALRHYVAVELSDANYYELRDDLLAIAGESHAHVAGGRYVDQCRLCFRDLRDEVHQKCG